MHLKRLANKIKKLDSKQRQVIFDKFFDKNNGGCGEAASGGGSGGEAMSGRVKNQQKKRKRRSNVEKEEGEDQVTKKKLLSRKTQEEQGYLDQNKARAAIYLQNIQHKKELQRQNKINSSVDPNEECPICFLNLNSAVVITSCCSKPFHKNCLEECKKSFTACPLCQVVVVSIK